MVRVFEFVREEVVVHVSNQLRWRWIIGGVLYKPSQQETFGFKEISRIATLIWLFIIVCRVQ